MARKKLKGRYKYLCNNLNSLRLSFSIQYVTPIYAEEFYSNLEYEYAPFLRLHTNHYLRILKWNRRNDATARTST